MGIIITEMEEYCPKVKMEQWGEHAGVTLPKANAFA